MRSACSASRSVVSQVCEMYMKVIIWRLVMHVNPQMIWGNTVLLLYCFLKENKWLNTQMTKNGSKWDKLRNNVNSYGVIEKRNSCIALLWAKPMKQGRGLRGHVHGNNCILLAHTSTSLCIDAPCSIFFFSERGRLYTDLTSRLTIISPPTKSPTRTRLGTNE